MHPPKKTQTILNKSSKKEPIVKKVQARNTKDTPKKVTNPITKNKSNAKTVVPVEVKKVSKINPTLKEIASTLDKRIIKAEKKANVIEKGIVDIKKTIKEVKPKLTVDTTILEANSFKIVTKEQMKERDTLRKAYVPQPEGADPRGPFNPKGPTLEEARIAMRACRSIVEVSLKNNNG